MIFKKNLFISDPDIFYAIQNEQKRQEKYLELIASENYVSLEVMEAQGSVMTNKYAEGYPNKRYYGGCKYIDIVENLAIARLKKIYSAEYVNVQPHSGSQANAAVYFSLLNTGDTILGMKLDHGGHLTHGSTVNFSGKIFNSIQYGVNIDTGLIDYSQIESLAYENKPKMIIAGGSAYSRIINWKKIRKIADSINAYFFVDMAHIAGLVAANLYPNPVEIADVVTSTTHKTLRGPRGGIILCKKNTEVSKKINSMVFPGIQGGPLMHVIAAKAVSFKEALSLSFKDYQRQVIENAKKMSKVFIERNYHVISQGTDTHLLLINLSKKKITGKKAEEALEKAHITVNKNTIPNDPQKAFITSGLRLGTPAITTRGLRTSECELIAHWISDILDDIQNNEKIQNIKKLVDKICQKFPIYKKYLR